MAGQMRGESPLKDGQCVLTDILNAARADANEVLADTRGKWPRLRFNSLDNMALAGLWSALGAADASAFEGEAHLIAHTSERWVFEFPQDFVHRLSDLKPGNVGEVAAAWATHEELMHIGADGPAVEPVVNSICAFARQAAGDEKSMLLLMTL